MKVTHVLSILLLSATFCRSVEEGLVDCEIEDGNTFLECSDSASGFINIRNGSLIPHNTHCLQEVDRTYVPVRCQDGAVIFSFSEGTQQNELLRIKRNVVEAATAGAGIGAAFGPVGAAVGGIFGAIVCIFVCDDDAPPPKYPPSIINHAVLEGASPIYAEEGMVTAVVTWKATKFEGDVQAIPVQSTYKSGDSFKEGRYVVAYTGTNSDGLSTSDDLCFEVKVHRCSPPGWPANGVLNCDSTDHIYGTTCTVKCYDGYVLGTRQESAKLTCDKFRVWSPLKVPSCKPRNCDAAPQIPNGNVECPRNQVTYGSICEAVCKHGYQVEGGRLMRCDTVGKWGKVPTCSDITPPQFKDGECPNDIQVYIDATNNTAMVKWEIPEGEDNSGDNPNITETHGYIPGQRFKAGSHTVKYTIKDKDNNRGDSCMFTIRVLTISCSPPTLNVAGNEHLKYDCPNAYMLGAKCNLACKSGYPMGGTDVIQCLRDPDIYPPKLDWGWRNGSLAPFCKETNCSMAALNIPENGALACSEWTHGQMCQMQCQVGYDIPNIGDGLFVCGRSNGQWRPSANVPDCDIQKDVTHMNLPGEFYYYSGKCNNSEHNLLQIQENFVNALNTSKFIEACIGVPECQARFVDVTCGPITARRKRSSQGGDRYKRSAKSNAYVLQFEFIVPFKKETGKSTNDVVAANEEMLFQMSDVIQTEVDAGHFDLNIDDLQVDGDSYGPGNPTMACPLGTIPRIETGTCVGCPKGKFSDRGRCWDCPIGKYQNLTNSIACISCPPGANTTVTGAKSIDQCLEYCSEGEYSPTGLSPCTKCDTNSYQSKSKSTTCQMCDKETRSQTNGATSTSQCLAFDIGVSETTVAVLKNTQQYEVSSVYMWIYFRNTTNNRASIQITNTEGDAVVTLMLTPTAEVTVDGTDIFLNESIPSSTWTNIVIVVHKRTGKLQLYISGKLALDESSLDFSKIYTRGLQDIVKIHGGMTISGFKLLPGAPTLPEISTWSSTCAPIMSNVTMTMDHLANTKNAMITIPSMCDPVNDCDSSPCGNHTCIDKLRDYECRCLNGFTGRQCQTPPDFCKDNNCKNGATCVSGSGNYTCDCPYGFKGSICETMAANGQWSNWTMWTMCSQSCGGGNQTRVRRCDSPPPDSEGKPCGGDNIETITCNEHICPECPVLRRTYGLRITCNETTDVKRCGISCRTGLYFSDEPLPYYECGQITGYKWNHQNEENPTGRLPSCTELQPPQQLAVSFHSVYNTIPCTADGMEGAKEAWEAKMLTVGCKMAGSCEATVHKPVCNAESKNHDVDSTLKITIELFSVVNATKESFNIESTLQNKSAPSIDLIHFAKLTLQLEKTAQDIFNNTVEFFQLAIDGIDHSLAPGYKVTFDKEIICPSGTVPLNVFCAECPVGSHCDGRSVTLCPRGQFQDKKSQSVCKKCPFGKNTPGVGTVNIAECTVVVESGGQQEDMDKVFHAIDNAATIAIAASTSIALLLAMSAIGLVLVRKHLRNRGKNTNTGKENLSSKSNDNYFTQANPLYESVI